MKKLLFFLVLFVAPAFAEQMKLEVIPLQHRTTDDVIPVIQPLVAAGGTITGMQNQLIIKTTPSNLDEIRQVLQRIDKAARRLMIYVKQDVDGETYRRAQSISGSYSSGDVSISNNSKRPRKGLIVSAEDRRGNHIQYRDLSTRSDLEDRNTFKVQTTDGQPAFVQSGQSVPIPNQNTFVTRGGIVVQDTTEYRDVTSGFYVLPRLQNGDRVTLLISPQLSRVKPNQGAVFEVQNAETTVSGYLGEWINIGGVNRNINDGSSGILHSTRHQERENRSILVKVEEIK